MGQSYINAVKEVENGSIGELIPCQDNSILFAASDTEFPAFRDDIIIVTANGNSYPAYLSNTSPNSGYIGEHIESVINSGSAVSLSTGTPTDITSISLTAGIWDLCGIVSVKGVVSGTSMKGSISLTSATHGTSGDNEVENGLMALTSPQSVMIPSYRLLLSSTTTVYLVTSATFLVGSVTAYGRISANRVA